MKNTISLKDAVSFSFSETAPCAYKVDFKVSADAVSQEFNKATKAAQKQAQIPGFRAGKAPLSLVRQRFASYILEDVEKSIFSASYEKLSTESKLDIVSFGEEEMTSKPAENTEYCFALNFEVAPKFDLPEYKSFTVEAEDGAPVEERVAKRVEYMKGLYSDFVTLEEPAAKGDMLKVSYESDYVPAEDASAALKRAAKADNAWLWLSEPEQFPGVIEAMLGIMKDSEKEVAIVYPEDWREEALRGKTVNYKFKVSEVQRKVAIEDDAKLAEKIGAESVEKMMERFTSDAKLEADQEKKNKLKESALDLVLKGTAEFDLPKGVLEATEQRELSRIFESLVHNEKDAETFKADEEKHKEDARNNACAYLRKFFILREIAKKEAITVSQQEVDEQIKALCAYYGYKEEQVRQALSQNGGNAEIQADILMNKVLDFIVDKK